MSVRAAVADPSAMVFGWAIYSMFASGMWRAKSDPKSLTDGELLAAWSSVESGEIHSADQAVLDEIETRNLDV